MVGRLVNNNDLEERLRAYGSQWRETYPFTNDVDTTRLARSQGKRVAAMVAAVVVVTVALVVAVAVRHIGSPNSNPIAPTPTNQSTTTTRQTPALIPTPLPTAEQIQVPLDHPNAPIAVGNGRVWVGTTTGVDAFDPRTLRRLGSVPTAQPVLEMVSTTDGLWIVTGRDDSLDEQKNAAYRLELVEPSTRRVKFSTELPFVPGYHSSWHLRLAATPGTAWVSLRDMVLRIDASNDAVTSVSLSGRGSGNIAADETGLWITSGSSYASNVTIVPLLHIDATTNAVEVISELPLGFYWSVATTDNAAWIVAATGATGMQLIRVDAGTHAVTLKPLPGIALVTGEGELWVQVIDPSGHSLNYNDLVGRIDLATGNITRTVRISIGEVPGSSGDGYATPPFAIANGHIWSTYNGLQRTTP
jgi:hypothetical protein